MSDILYEMEYVREIVKEGLKQRQAAGIKLRQPLQDVTISKDLKDFDDHEQYEQIIKDELNVKEVKYNERSEQ